MKQNAYLLLIFFSAFLFSCRQSNTEAVQTNQNKDEAFFPIVDFVEGQIKEVDSMPLAIFRLTEVDNRKDSQIVDRAVFHRAAQEFLHPDITSPELKPSYSENLYMDETIHMVVLTYQTGDEEKELKKAEIYVNPDNDKVKSLYLEKEELSGDTLIRKKLYWKTNRNFQVVVMKEIADQPIQTRVEKYIWDNRD